jgi:hypothetical protein
VYRGSSLEGKCMLYACVCVMLCCRFGAVLENVVINPRTAEPDFNNE